MMKATIVCPNKNDPAWKSLVAGLGDERYCYVAFFRNGNVIPDVATARALLFRKSPTLPAPEPETKSAAALSPASKLAPKQTFSKSKKQKATVPKAAIQFLGQLCPRSRPEILQRSLRQTTLARMSANLPRDMYG